MNFRQFAFCVPYIYIENVACLFPTPSDLCKDGSSLKYELLKLGCGAKLKCLEEGYELIVMWVYKVYTQISCHQTRIAICLSVYEF